MVGARLLAAAVVSLAAGRAMAMDGLGPGDSIESVTESEFVGAIWNDLRQCAVGRGVDLSVVYDGEGFANIIGGVKTGTAYLGVLHLQLTLDGSKLLGWPGLTVFVHGLGTHGRNPSDLVGDAQGVSSLAAPAGWQLYEAWLQQNLFDGHLSLLLGRYDLGTEFYRLQSATLFLNSSFGTGLEFAQSGRGGPSIFPDTSVGGRIAFKPSRDFVLRVALLDGVPVQRPDESDRAFASGDGYLLVAEADFLSRPAPEGRPLSRHFRIGRGAQLNGYDGKIALGGWYYSAQFQDLSEREPDGRPVTHHGSAGAYLLVDQMVSRSAAQPRRQLNAFVQLGVGDSRVNRFGYYAGGGLVLSGLFPALASDELGLAVAIARNGSHYIDMQREEDIPVTGTETAVELTHLFQFGQHFALQPDLQYVMRPGTDPRQKDARAVALHFEIAF